MFRDEVTISDTSLHCKLHLPLVLSIWEVRYIDISSTFALGLNMQHRQLAAQAPKFTAQIRLHILICLMTMKRFRHPFLISQDMVLLAQIRVTNPSLLLEECIRPLSNWKHKEAFYGTVCVLLCSDKA